MRLLFKHDVIALDKVQKGLQLDEVEIDMNFSGCISNCQFDEIME
jgi:hypothetical protein